MELNVYFILILITVVLIYKADLLAELLNLRALGEELPPEFRDTFDAETYTRSQDYTRERTRLGVIESTASLGIFLFFWFAGGFAWLDGWSRTLVSGEVPRGLVCLSFLVVASGLLSLPFEVYHTFVVEERFGFNKTTWKTFSTDRLKSLLLSAALGLPLAALVLWMLGKWEFAWFYAFCVVTGVSLVLMFLAPRFILPLFNKFTPLEEGDLSRGIEDLARRTRFPLGGIFVIDGSQRSTKTNAFFTGFGRNKRIALFDTLIKEHPVPELIAVLAHEIGHYRKKHIIQGIVSSIGESALMFFLLGFFLRNEGLHAAFGIAEPSVAMGLILFGILYTPAAKLSSILRSVWSRHNEFEADAFAAEVTGHPEDLVDALKRLTRNNLGNLTPHPFHVFLNHSHPPVALRVAALRQRG